MGWEQRLREMVLAGGVIAVASSGWSATGCSSGGSTGSPAGSSGGSSSSSGSSSGFSCCNGNGDPCCEYLYCGGALTAECSAKQCVSDGGTYAPPVCTLPDASAGGGEAGAD